MAKEDVVAAGLKAIQDGEVAVISEQLGVAFDGGKLEGGGDPLKIFTQADLDAAVKVKADADSVALNELAAKESMEADQLAKIKAVLGLA